MKTGRLLIGVIAVGGAVGWLAPGLGVDPQKAARASDQSSSATDQWLAGETALQRGPDGHFYADVAVDGTTVPMMVDTGASVIALTGADAGAIGLSWDDADVRPVARGASGPVLGVAVVLDRVTVGGIEAEGVAAIIVPEGLGVSLLGQSFLSLVGRVDTQGDVMVLGG